MVHRKSNLACIPIEAVCLAHESQHRHSSRYHRGILGWSQGVWTLRDRQHHRRWISDARLFSAWTWLGPRGCDTSSRVAAFFDRLAACETWQSLEAACGDQWKFLSPFLPVAFAQPRSRYTVQAWLSTLYRAVLARILWSSLQIQVNGEYHEPGWSWT